MESNFVHKSSRNKQLLWFGAAVGTTVGVAVWAYSRRELSYWDKTRRAAGHATEIAAEMNPWLGAGTAALGCAALAYRLSERKSSWQRVREGADVWLSPTTKRLRPWASVIASAAVSAASAAYNAKSRRRATDLVADGAASAADGFADVGSRIWRRLRTISKEAAELHPRVRKVLA